MSRWHFDVLNFICHLFDESVNFLMSVVVCHGLQVSESLYKQLSHQQKVVCWSKLCQ